MANERLFALKRVYEDGLKIFHAAGLNGTARYIAPSSQPDFDEDSAFEQRVIQGWKPQRYEEWWQNLKNCFSENQLNYLRFDKKVMDVDKREHSNLPAANFRRALDEVERMITSSDYFDSYITTGKLQPEWPEITYSAGVIAQGLKSHKFTNDACIRLLNGIWEQRELQLPDKTVTRAGARLGWEHFKSIDDAKATAQAINKSMREKHISLRLTYPARAGGMVLVATQLQ